MDERQRGNLFSLPHRLEDPPSSTQAEAHKAGMQALWILIHPRGSLNMLFLPVYQGFLQLWLTPVI